MIPLFDSRELYRICRQMTAREAERNGPWKPTQAEIEAYLNKGCGTNSPIARYIHARRYGAMR